VESRDLSPLALRDAVDDRLRDSDIASATARLSEERLRRVSQRRQPLVIEWQDREGDPAGHFSLAPPPGSIMLLWARNGNELLDRLGFVYLAHDVGEAEAVHQLAAEIFASRRLLTLDEAVDGIVGAPSFFDFKYATKTLATYVTDPPDDGIGSLVMAYNGGPINVEEFSVWDHTQGAPVRASDVIVVVRKPSLSALEQSVLQAVPGNMREVHLTTHPIGFVPTLVAGAVAIVLTAGVLTLTTLCCEPFHSRLRDVSLPPDVLRTLGPIPSAHELLTMRVRVFQEFAVRG
jgi:hypothetical protein